MPVIRISDENWERLKRWAVPLEDSVDDALSRVLNVAEQHARQSQDGQFTNTVNGLGQPESDDSDTRASYDHQINTGTPTRRRQGRGQKVPQSSFELPILKSLDKLGGKARVRDVLDEVEQRMKPLLGAIDYEFPETGTEARWRNTARWARAALIQKGLIKPNSDSERGVWELTPRGVAEARNKNQ